MDIIGINTYFTIGIIYTIIFMSVVQLLVKGVVFSIQGLIFSTLFWPLSIMMSVFNLLNYYTDDDEEEDG